MESLWPVAIFIVSAFVGVLDFCKPSTAVVLRSTTTLLVTKVLAGSRSEKSYKIDQHSHQTQSFLLLTDMLSILDASPKFGLIVWWRERLFLTSLCASTSVEKLHMVSDNPTVSVNTIVAYLRTKFRILKHD